VRAHRHGVALILVILALAGVFALVTHLSLVARSSQIESRVLIERLRDERDARAAALLAITGLGATTPLASTRTSGAGGSDTGEAAPPPAPTEPEVQLPEIVRELLRAAGKLDEIEGGAKDIAEDITEQQQRVQSSPGVGDSGRRRVRFGVLREIGLPPGPVPVRVGERVYAVTIRDAVGGLNINAAPEAQLRRYFELKGVPSERAANLVEQIIHWRDPSQALRPGSAAADEYRTAGIVPRRGELQSLEELLYLPAMDRALFEAIRDDLTLTGDTIHAGSASPEVLRSIPGLPESVAQEILRSREEYRLTPKGLEGLLPLGSAALSERLRAEPLNFLEVIVQRTAPAGPAYRGLVAIGDRRIVAFGLKLD
jgi:hypothetical protein